MNITDEMVEEAAIMMAALANNPLHAMDKDEADEWRMEARAGLRAAEPLIRHEERQRIADRLEKEAPRALYSINGVIASHILMDIVADLRKEAT